MRADFLIGPSVVFQLAEWRHRSHRRSWGSGMRVVYFSHTSFPDVCSLPDCLYVSFVLPRFFLARLCTWLAHACLARDPKGPNLGSQASAFDVFPGASLEDLTIFGREASNMKFLAVTLFCEHVLLPFGT